MLKRIGRAAVVAAAFGCLPAFAFAQGGNAAINGTVFDQGKAVLPGVTVTATNEATGLTREAVTGPEGRFVIPTLNPGVYTVRADPGGARTPHWPGAHAGVHDGCRGCRRNRDCYHRGATH
jgi:hypothetical protein